MNSEDLIGIAGLGRTLLCLSFKAPPLGFVCRITVLYIEIGILPGIDRSIAHNQFHLIATLGAVPPCRHD